MEDITIAICTKLNQLEFQQTKCFNSIERLGLFPEATIFYENSKGLSECYNKVLTDTEGQDTCILFMHDDVVLMDILLRDKLDKCFEKFDVLGVAGSSDFSIRRLPITWINSPKESWSGGLYHTSIDGSSDMSNLKFNAYGDFNKKCFTIDGAFMAIDRKKIGNVRFQEEFLFDFYDLAFCTECFKAGIKIGTVPIALCHQSHGSGILKPEYKDVQDIFIKKYKANKT
jgi:GT2 family glycosyltransferase